MIVNVWLIAKQGEPRVYTRTLQPAEDQVAAFRKDGFKLFRVEVHMPVDWDDVDEVLDAFQVELVEAEEVGQPEVVSSPRRALERSAEPERKVIYCPKCNARHYDEFDPVTEINWATRLHRKHLCGECKHIWQEADHYTVGV